MRDEQSRSGRNAFRARGVSTIRKFISIENVGKFRACKPTGDVELRPLTLIYAENGRGKTTLCDILVCSYYSSSFVEENADSTSASFWGQVNQQDARGDDEG